MRSALWDRHRLRSTAAPRRNFFEKTFGGIGQGTGSIEKTFCAAAQSTYVSGASCAPSALTDTFDNKDAERLRRRARQVPQGIDGEQEASGCLSAECGAQLSVSLANAK